MTTRTLDLDLYTDHGNKITSVLVDAIAAGDTLTTAEQETLARLIYEKYSKQWEHLFGIFTADYDPTYNYSMTEQGNREDNTTNTPGVIETVDRSTKKNQTTTTREGYDGYTEHEEISQIHPETTVTSGQRVSTNQVSPEDTEDWKNTNKATDEQATDVTRITGDDKTTRDTTHTGAKTTATEYTGPADTEQTKTSREGQDLTKFLGEHTLKRFGNIGVTTTQQLLESERSLWENYNFWDIINTLAARELTANFY